MKKQSGFKASIFLVIVMTVSAMLLTLVSELTRKRIEDYQKTQLAKKICISAGMEDMDTDASLLEFYSGGRTIRKKALTIIDFKDRGFSAVIFSGPGLWAQIRAVICVKPGLTESGFKADKLLGLQIIQQGETPGLGGRIEEKWFTDQFRNFPLKNGMPEIVNGRKPRHENEVDGITGATMTGQYLEEAISGCIKQLVAKERKNEE